MKRLFFAAVSLIAIGLVLLMISFFWTNMVPDDMVWSDEQADAHRRASLAYHETQFDKSASEIELRQLREEFEALDGKLSAAKRTKNGPPIYLRWAGTMAAGLGALVLLALREQD